MRLSRFFRDLPARIFRRLRFLNHVAMGLVPFALLAPGYLFHPVVETLPGPRKAVLRSTVSGLKLGVSARWYDLGLNKHPAHRETPFGAGGVVDLPEYRISTTASRLWLKRLLTRWDRWSECENCYGPIAYASLYRIGDYTPPEKTRLTQNQSTDGDTVFFEVGLMLDETQFEERPLQVDDFGQLMAEVAALIKAGGDVNITPESFGPALRRLNPVRAERYRDSLIVWMGGKIGYSLTPGSAGGPFLHGAWLTGTEYAGIQKIERM